MRQKSGIILFAILHPGRAAGGKQRQLLPALQVREPYWQSITTGLMLCFFILLQSVVLAVRESGGMKLKLLNRIKTKEKTE